MQILSAKPKPEGQEYAGQEAQQAIQKMIEEAEEAFKVKQATMQVEMAHMKQQHELLVASLTHKLATAKGNLEREQSHSKSLSQQMPVFL